MKRTTAWACIASAILIVFSAGCANGQKDRATHHDGDSEPARAEFFQKQGEDRVNPFVHAQAGNGARHDAMLYDHHFTGGQLNSLGRSKVLLMFADAERIPAATVYLVNCGAGELLAQRKAAVELYFKTADGPNPAAAHPAAPQMARLPKTESGAVKVETAESADPLGGLLGGSSRND